MVLRKIPTQYTYLTEGDGEVVFTRAKGCDVWDTEKAGFELTVPVCPAT